MASESIVDRTNGVIFRYESGKVNLWRYIPVGVIVSVVYYVLESQGHQPLSEPVFLVLLGLMAYELLVMSVLWMRSPKMFSFNDEVLLARWGGDWEAFSLREIRVLKSLRFLTSNILFLRIEKRTIIVFKNLNKYDEFVQRIHYSRGE